MQFDAGCALKFWAVGAKHFFDGSSVEKMLRPYASPKNVTDTLRRIAV